MSGRDDRILALETTIENLEELVSGAYRSIRVYKGLCVILTVVLILGVAGGFIGLVRVLGGADRIDSLRVSIEDDVKQVHEIREELRLANARVLQEVWQSVPEVLHKLEQDISARLGKLEEEVDVAIDELEKRSDIELRAFSERLQRELDALDLDIQTVRTIFRGLADAFIAAEADYSEMLTSRQRQLLALMAREMVPQNPAISYEAAKWALTFSDYDEAIAMADEILEMPGLDVVTLEKARTLRKRAAKMRANPPEIRHQSPGRTRVGPYGVFELHYHTLLTLEENGYLTKPQVQEILEKSKKMMRSPSLKKR